MQEKVIDYGTSHEVEVDSATSSMMIVLGTEVRKAFVLLGHGLKDLPKKGDKGTIIFERDSKRGHWQWYPKIPKQK